MRKRAIPFGAAALVAASCASPPDRGVPVDAGASPDSGQNGEVVTLIDEDFEGLEGDYEAGDALGDWTILRAVGTAVVAGAADEGIPPRRGNTVFRFSEFSEDPGFSESRIDRCVEFDPQRPMSFRYDVYADIAVDFVTNDLRVRINPNFYTDIHACRDDVSADSTSNRLEELGAWYNEDWDVRLESAGAEPRAWFHADRATDNAPAPELRIEPEYYPEGATAVRFSVRVRDDIYTANPSRRLFLDDIRLTQP